MVNFTRRDFLKFSFVSAASLALSACGRPVEHGLVSQYQMPEYTLPGQPLFWASCCTQMRADAAVSVKTVENRAINTIGVPGSPHSKGKVNRNVVAGLQELYHPDRLQQSTKKGKAETQEETVAAVASELGKAGRDNALWVVERLCGSLGGLMVELAASAGAKIWVLDTHASVTERRVMKALNGRAMLPFYPIEKSDYVVTFGSDFLHNGYQDIRASWGYGHFRQGRDHLRGTMISVSSRMSPTDACSDRWLPVRPGSEGYVAIGVGNLLAEAGMSPWPEWAKDVSWDAIHEATGLDNKLIEELAHRLASAKNPMAVAGGGLTANGDKTLYAVHALNRMLRKGAPEMFEPDMVLGRRVNSSGVFVSAKEAVEMLDAKDCKAVWVFDCDPVYQMPQLAEKLAAKTRSTCFTPFPNDTSTKCVRSVAIKTWMEDWGDLRLFSPDGDFYFTRQPAVRERSEWSFGIGDLLLQAAAESKMTAGGGAASMKELLQGDRSEAEWSSILARGGIWDAEDEPTYPHRANYPPAPMDNAGAAPAAYSPFEFVEAFELQGWDAKVPAAWILQPFQTTLGDGRLANRPWFQELPEVMTTVVWDSWVEMNDETAKHLHLKRHDLVDVEVEGHKPFRAAVYVSPTVHPDVIAMPVGRGHQNYGEWASIGTNPLAHLDSTFQESGERIWQGSGVKITKLHREKMLTTTDTRVFKLPRHILPE